MRADDIFADDRVEALAAMHDGDDFLSNEEQEASAMAVASQLHAWGYSTKETAEFFHKRWRAKSVN